MIKKQKKADVVLSVFLYSLPVVFFAACYFLMTVTGEDLLQGAGRGNLSLSRASEAFSFNARLSDMYAWTVIGVFDYRFCFGVDTIFRAVDVLMGTSIIYIISCIGIGRRLRVRIGDALVFNAVFLAVLLNKNCESLYIAFSHIHNYLIIGFFSLLFFVPFARKLQGLSVPDGIGFKLYMIISGFLFGFSSNVTPITFLVSFAICFLTWLVYMICTGKKVNPKKLLVSWETFAITGVLAACALMYGMGRGFSSYINDGYINATDYISFESIFFSPGTFIPKTLNHVFENFREMLPCILLMLFALLAEVVMYRIKHRKGSDLHGIVFVACCTLFVIMNVLAMSQVNILSLIRLVMPAYFVTVSAVCFTALRLIKLIKPQKAVAYVCSVALTFMSLGMTVDVSAHRYEYNRRIGQVIQKFEETKNGFYYIPYSMIHIEKSRIFGFNQYCFVQDWVVGQVEICGKTAYIDYNS